MIRPEVIKLMGKMSNAYPMLKDRDQGMMIDLWAACLRDADAAAVNRAFVRYYQEDVRNLPPTPGNLLELVSEELPDLQWEE